MLTQETNKKAKKLYTLNENEAPFLYICLLIAGFRFLIRSALCIFASDAQLTNERAVYFVIK